ncbi:hypothetical protein HZH68_003925 [Vespula germanica]|uniref:Uncharacterized protein n=1 Tax=Vespula germanica TaxID=30212 RepID=A0A836UWI6_VESGE|nr:hypothetical protein HZH68_003925 [Vespula germanica]
MVTSGREKYGRIGRKETFPVAQGPLQKRNISAPIGQIWTKKIWAYRAQRDFSSGTGPAVKSTIVSILTRKTWAHREQRDLSNNPATVPLGARVSEKKIVKMKFFFPLFYINRYITAPVGQIWTKKILGFRAHRDIPNGTGPAPISTMVSVRSGRKKYGRIGRKETFPTAAGLFL